MFVRRLLAAFATALAFNLRRLWLLYAACAAALCIVAFCFYAVFLAAPPGFPAGQVITIKKGTALPAIITQLVAAHVIDEPFLFDAMVRVSGGAHGVYAGSYRFNTLSGVLEIAARLVTGESGIPPARLTFVEGETARSMSAQVAKALPGITASDFIDAAQPYEGYLFPDTYTFASDATAASIVATLRANFDTKIQPLLPAVSASGHSLSDIVIMASIVEKEARTPTDKKLVAGVLWNRISRGMPLQVDAVFGYINGRAEYAPSLEDLVVDSPYNTYEHKGLPPGPISNPGFDSLNAAVNPTNSNYLYYLSDRNGVIHYATTYAAQQANQKKYLP